jgi:hypothetical protein
MYLVLLGLEEKRRSLGAWSLEELRASWSLLFPAAQAGQVRPQPRSQALCSDAPKVPKSSRGISQWNLFARNVGGILIFCSEVQRNYVIKIRFDTCKIFMSELGLTFAPLRFRLHRWSRDWWDTWQRVYHCVFQRYLHLVWWNISYCCKVSKFAQNDYISGRFCVCFCHPIMVVGLLCGLGFP